MKIRVNDVSHEGGGIVVEGKYEYIENTLEEGKPSFFISVGGLKKDYEIYFICDNKEELEGIMETIQDRINTFKK